jgi:hypothetical protein
VVSRERVSHAGNTVEYFGRHPHAPSEDVEAFDELTNAGAANG